VVALKCGDGRECPAGAAGTLVFNWVYCVGGSPVRGGCGLVGKDLFVVSRHLRNFKFFPKSFALDTANVGTLLLLKDCLLRICAIQTSTQVS